MDHKNPSGDQTKGPPATSKSTRETTELESADKENTSQSEDISAFDVNIIEMVFGLLFIKLNV